jgi:hypothetical protein
LSERNQKNDPAVVDLEKARAQLRSRGQASTETLQAEIETIRDLLDRGLTREGSRATNHNTGPGNQPAIGAGRRALRAFSGFRDARRISRLA